MMAIREAAWRRWQELGWPTTRNEAWRNFSTKPLHALDLGAGITGHEIAPDVIAALPSPRVVLVDGRYAARYSVPAPGVEISPIADAQLDLTTPPDGAMEALNTALFLDGVRVFVPAGVAATLHIALLTTGAGVAHTRVVVDLADGASLTLGQSYLGLTAQPYLINAVLELSLAHNSALTLGTCVREGAEGSRLEAVHARVAANASLRTFTLVTSGARVRSGSTVRLEGAGANAEVDGLYLGKGRQKLDHVCDIQHVVGDTRSAETWAGVLDERAEGGFQGVIRMARDAARSATRQLTRTLLLSNDAEAHAKPELHIDCDDVTASHGATIGQLDAMEQFYLESRGIAPDAARRMLIRAFVDKHLALVPDALHAAFSAAVADAIGPVAVPEVLEDIDLNAPASEAADA